MHAEHAMQARRAYERGRLRTSLWRTAPIVACVGILSLLVVGRAGLLWLPITAVLWLLANWRGGPVLRGAYVGVLGGLVTLVLPMTVLRPCCSPEAMAQGMSCCVQPSACLTAGALLGLVLAAFLPAGSSRWRAATGMALGVGSVAVLRCSTLFAAEALGLAGGLVAGLLAAMIGRAVAGKVGVVQ